MARITRSAGHDDGEPLADIEVEAKPWVAALTLTGLVMTLLLVAGLCVATSARHTDQACFRKEINGEHTLMEAFFPNPPERNAITEAIRACSPVSPPADARQMPPAPAAMRDDR